MRWLITGGCGFIGTGLVRALLAQGSERVRVVDNLTVGSRTALGEAGGFRELATDQIGPLDDDQPAGTVELGVGDSMDDGLALRICAGADVIVHLAANAGVAPSVEDPRGDCLTNVIGTLNYLEAARACQVKRFVFASSGAPIGECTPPIHEEMAPHPVSPYGASKLAGEGYCSAYFKTFGVETVALRFGNVYGPGSGHKQSVVAKFIAQALAGEALEIYGDGGQTRDFIFIDDLIEAIRLAATVPEIGGETFQIATNAETTVAELVDQLLAALAEAEVAGAEVRHGAPRLGDVRRNFSDTAKARERLGWTCRTALGDGLRRTVRDFLKNSG